MKKLILVTLTAFAASWLLAEVRREDSWKPPRPPSPPPLVRAVPGQGQPDNSGQIRTIPWKKASAPRSNKRGQATAPAILTPPARPVRVAKEEAPPWFPKTELEEDARIRDDGSRVVVGRVSASEERARKDLQEAVERAVSEWLAADVATSWKVPDEVLGRMVQGTYIQEVARNLIEPEAGVVSADKSTFDGLFNLYRAGQKLDFSATSKANIIGIYRQELASQRLHRLGGALALALATLAALSGYIKADEATKGYYTNRLRFAAAAGLGVAGTVVYRFLV